MERLNLGVVAQNSCHITGGMMGTREGGRMNSRKKGLEWVREVKKLLEGLGHQIEGPGYGVAFYRGSMKPIHRDYFGIADLISFFNGAFFLHQVTDLSNKSTHVKAIQKAGLPCWVWCRVPTRPISYRIFIVNGDRIEEAEARFKT